jgi:hypothetical protein
MADSDAGPYGPQTARVRRFLQQAAALPPAEWEEVVRRYRAACAGTQFVEADYHLGAAVEATGRVAARDALVAPVLRLAEARGGDEAGAEALLGAALALVVSDRLDADLFEVLYAPFAAHVPLARLVR